MTKASPGPDDTPNIFLHLYDEMVSKFVIFRASILSDPQPPGWLTARVVHLFKKGDVALMPNYRPIPITSSRWKHYNTPSSVPDNVTYTVSIRDIRGSRTHSIRDDSASGEGVHIRCVNGCV